MDFLVNGVPFDPSSMTVTDSFGVKMSVSRLRFFLAKPWFLDDNGDTVATFPSTYLLPSLFENGQVVTLGQVDAHLHTMGFLIGLDSATNHADPLQWTEAPLTDATMHWGWNPAVGYQFVQVEGRFDQNGDGIVNTSDPNFFYHCGGDVLLTEKQLEVHTDADAGGTVVITLACEVGDVFRGIDVVQDPVGEVPSPLTRRVVDNLKNAITHP
ncbi:MAG: hypothetical protein JNL05_10720 [Flavobacteriales bacterium]|nr:hypothetical protein [Flavobacteriales bacterium]